MTKQNKILKNQKKGGKKNEKERKKLILNIKNKKQEARDGEQM